MKVVSTVGLFLFVAMVVERGAAQAASVQVVGPTCAGSPGMSVTGVPRLGQSCTLVYSGPNLCCTSPALHYSIPHLILAASPTTVTMPGFVGTSQPSNCPVLAFPGLLVSMPYVGGTSLGSTYVVNVPNNAALIGATLYAQWVVQNGGCNSSNSNCANTSWVPSAVAWLQAGL